MTATEALHVASRNRFRAWFGNDLSARSRFAAAGLFPVHHVPKFPLARTDRLFTIGSCFARAMEMKLEPFGLPVLLQGSGVPIRHFQAWKESDDAPGADVLNSGAFNKYTTESIESELHRVLLEQRFENEGLIELGPDQWFDPHSSGLKPLPLALALANRKVIDGAMQRVREADVVVITLGQTESWIDTHSGLAVNVHPGPAALRKFGGRFVFVEHSYQETVAQVERSIQLVRRTCNPGMRFILTVSPVPFSATFRPQDVMVAHQATKALLRSAAEELFRSHDFVDYFPSYEMVINTPRELAWQSDQVHVQPEMVEHVVNTFVSSYYGADVAQAAAI